MMRANGVGSDLWRVDMTGVQEMPSRKDEDMRARGGQELPVRRQDEGPARMGQGGERRGQAERRASDRPLRRRWVGAWLVVTLVLLTLGVGIRVLLPPPALAGQDRTEVESGRPAQGARDDAPGLSGVTPWQGRPAARLPATAAEAERAQEAAAAAAARAVGPQDGRSERAAGSLPNSAPNGAAGGQASGPAHGQPSGQTNGPVSGQASGQVNGQTNGQAAAPGPLLPVRPDYVSEIEWQVLQGVAAQSRDPARTLATLVAKLRFSKQLELFRSGAAGVPREALAAQLLADLPAQVAAGSLARDEALRLLPLLIEPLAPDPAARAARLQQERARLPGQALQTVP